MKKQGFGWLMIMMALVLVCQGILPVTSAQAEGDVIIDKLTAEYIFDSLGDALNYGTVAREWDQNAHAETSACVDVLDRHTNTVFANTDSTYFHAMNYKLEVNVSAPQSLQGMSFALYRYDGENYVRCEGTEITVAENVKSTDLTWEIDEDLKNTRLYVFQTDGDGYVADSALNGVGLTVNYGASVSASAQNDNYIGKIVIHQQMGEGDSMGFFNTFKNSPSLTFGPDTRAYYKEFNQETQEYEYIEIIPGVTEKNVGNVLVNYYYTADKDYAAADGDGNLTMGYTKMDGLSYVDGQFVRNGSQVVGVRYLENGGYADELLDNAEKFSKEIANLGGGDITSLIPDTTGGSTVTGPVTEDGYVVSLYDAEVGADGIFRVKQDMGWDGIPVAENEYVIINLICPTKDGEVLMGTDSSDITYFYKEGQGKGEGVMWGTADSNSSQRVIFNFVYADENGILQPFEGTINPSARHGGTLLAPKANVELIKEVHNGAIIANYVYNGQEIHQRTIAPLGRKTWVKMDGGYLTLEKASVGYNWGTNMWEDMSDDVALDGAVFGVYSDSACTDNNLVTTLTTGKDGKATSDLLASGTYWVKEITPLKDHNLLEDVVEVTVVAGETVKVQGPGRYEQTGWPSMGNWIVEEGKFANQQNNGYVSLRIVKQDEFGDELQGAQFGIYTRQQTGYGPRPQYSYTLIASATTNRNGVAILDKVPLSYQDVTYYIREIAAPDGYRVGSEEYIQITLEPEDRDTLITVDGNGNAEGVAFVNNVIRGNMALKKVDVKTNANLEGAEFTIYSDKNCTEVVGVMTTKRGGDAESRNVIPGKDGLVPGTYYVKETKAPVGYMANDTVYKVEVLPGKIVDVATGNEIARAPEATAIGNSQGINFAGTKVWYDEGFEGNRPQEVRINLYRGEENQPLRSTLVSARTEWKFAFENLPRYDENGDEIEYIIREDLGGKAFDYYSYVTEKEEQGTVTVTVSNAIRKTKITGQKTWEDTVQYDADRPNDITFLLYQQVGDELVPVKDQFGQQMTAVGSNWNGYRFEFNNLPSYDSEGNKAEYVVQEAESDKYVMIDSSSETKTEQGNTFVSFTLVNRLTVPLKGTKTWQDSGNADGQRPENVTLVVYQNGQKMNPQPTIVWDKETDTDVWQWSVEGLAKYGADNSLNTYTVKEDPVPRDYIGTVSEDGLNFVNTKPGSIRLYKVYQDWMGNNQPLNGAEFMLYWDEECQNPVSDQVYVTAQNGPTRNGFIEINNLVPGDYYIREETAPQGYALPVPNKPIKVTVVSGQTARVNGEHGVVVNLSEYNNITVSVEKVWAGDENKADARPQNITVQLYQNNNAMAGQTRELNSENGWSAEFTGLPSKDYFGNTSYTYTVKETAVVPGYLTAVSGSVEEGFTITNTYNLTDISVKKEWVGLSSLDEKPEVEVQLLADGTAVDGMKATLNENNSWAYTFEALPIKTADGTEINYSVEETTVLSDFATTYSGDKQNGFVVTNTVSGGYITLKKVDGDNNSALSGAKFGIYADEACQNLAAEMTTGYDGVATSGVLKVGTWYVKEMEAPQGYQLDPAARPVAVTVVKDQTVTVQGDGQNGAFTNVKRAVVYIKKVEAKKNEYNQYDANSAKPLAGAEFTIYSDGNCSQVVAVMVTDENGYAEAALVPGRQYWVKETKAPAGYTIVVTGTKDFWANLGDPMQLTWGNWDQNINGAMVNEKQAGGAITLIKADAADSNVKLSGAVFGVYSDNACQNLIAQMPATDENGASSVDMPAGTWYVKEITAPGGYALNTTVYTVNVQVNQTAQVNNGNPVPNEKKDLSVKAQLTARKTVNGSSNIPSGYYSFELYEVVNGQRTKLETVQNAAGTVTFSEITYTQAGIYQYVMKEVAGSLPGVAYDTNEYTATVTVTENNDGALTAAVSYGSDGSTTPPTFANQKNTVNVKVTKVWNHDGNSMTNTWPASADVVLLIDGEWPSNGQYMVRLNSNNNWTHTWNDLPKYRTEDGQQVEIEYEIYENGSFDGYVSKLEREETGDENEISYTLTNTYIKKDQKLELKVPVKKIVTGGKTDEEFTFRLSAQPSDPPAPMPEDAPIGDSGNPYITAKTTGSAEGTTVYFDTIEITAEKVMYDGVYAPYDVTYGWSVSEEIPDPQNPYITYDEGHYELMVRFNFDQDGKLQIAQREVWDDDWENIIGYEPDVYIIHYDAEWNMTEIPYNNGNYELPFTNTMEQTQGGFKFTKQTADGKALPGAVFGVYSDADCTALVQEITSGEDGVVAMTGLTAGETYYIKEITAPTGYVPDETVYSVLIETDVDDKPVGENGVIINQMETTSVSGEKVWVDEDNAYTTRPESITVYLMADGRQQDEKTVTAQDNWAWTFDNLPKYNSEGQLISYTFTEAAVDGYTAAYSDDGRTITNTLNQVEASFMISKWINSAKPESMPVLDIVFVVEPQEDYSGKLVFDNPAYSAKNPFTVTVKGDKEGEIIETAVEMNVLQAGTYRFKVYEQTTDADGNLNVPDGWCFDTSVIFADIKVEAGTDGRLQSVVTYDTGEFKDIIPYEFVNWHSVSRSSTFKLWKNYNGEESIDVKLYYREQSWNDEAGKYDYGSWQEYRGDYEVEIKVYDAGEIGEEVLWNIQIEDLPGYIGNKDVTYGVAEIDLNENYLVTYLDSDDNPIAEGENGLLVAPYGGTIVNAPKYQNLTVEKWWEDDLGSSHDQRPAVELTLYFREKNSDDAWTAWTSSSVTPTIEKHSDDGSAWWSFTYNDLPVSHNGQEIEFAVQETVPDGYVAQYRSKNGAEKTEQYAANGESICNTLISGTRAQFSLGKTVSQLGNVQPDGSEVFSFTVSGNGLAEDITVSLKAGEENTVNLVFDKAGTYTYTIIEKEPDQKTAGMVYSPEKYAVEYVVELADSHLTIGRETWYKFDEDAGEFAEIAAPDKVMFTNKFEQFAVTLTKTDKQTGAELSGAVYGLFDNENCDGDPIYTIQTGADGTGKLDDVEKGVYWLKEITAPDGYDVDPKAYQVVIPADENDASAPIEMPVQDYALGKVKVQKEWAGDMESDRPASITVQLLKDGEAEGDPITLSAANSWQAEVDGLQMYDPETDEKYTYTWEETVPDGYRQTGNETTEDGDGVEVTTLTNTLYVADGEIQFSGTKTLTGDRALAAEEFSFQLKDADGNVIETVKNAADGSFAFTAIQYTLDQVGEHTYTVEELAGSDREITYDDTVYEITVTVSDNGDGTLNVTASMDETALNFVNEYEKYEADGELTLDVEKVLNGRAFQSGDSFTFTVSAVSGVPMPERTMVTITPSEGSAAKVDFGKIEYTENDADKTYTYTVKEVAGSQEGITYDDKFHTVTVKITDNGDGTLNVVPTYTDGDKVILTNIYNAEGELTLDVEKMIRGRAFREGDVFTFTVEAADGVPMPEMAEVVIEPASGTTAKVDFGKITYSLADAGKTYEYTVKETTGSLSGVTYDQNAYTVTVQVADNGQGGLMVTPVYTNGSRVTFVNTYAASGIYQLTAQKNLTGKDLTDRQFTFVLRNEQGKEIETAQNDADGRIAFREFRFSQNDIGKTYTYYVSERNGAQDGYIYDTTVYTVKLTVVDNGDGTLAVEVSGIPADGMVFENIFDNNTGVSFIKKWQGKEGPAITLTLYQNGVKMDPQPEYVKNGNVYSYENLPRFDENDKEIVYSAKESFMNGYLTIYENKAPYQNVTDQVMNGGTIINRSVTDFSVRKEWQGLGKNEEAPAITLTLYCNGEPMNVATPTPDADGWYTYKNLPGTVNGVDAVYTVVETEVEGFTTSYSNGGDCAYNGDTIVNRKIPKTGDDSMIGLWMAVTAASAGAFLMLMKKRRNMG